MCMAKGIFYRTELLNSYFELTWLASIGKSYAKMPEANRPFVSRPFRTPMPAFAESLISPKLPSGSSIKMRRKSYNICLQREWAAFMDFRQKYGCPPRLCNFS